MISLEEITTELNDGLDLFVDGYYIDEKKTKCLIITEQVNDMLTDQEGLLVEYDEQYFQADYWKPFVDPYLITKESEVSHEEPIYLGFDELILMLELESNGFTAHGALFIGGIATELKDVNSPLSKNPEIFKKYFNSTSELLSHLTELFDVER